MVMSTGERAAENRAAAIGALAAILSAGLAEDEAAAKLAAESGNQFANAEFAAEWHRVNRSVMVESDAGAIVFDEGAPSEVQADHIARHDPARTLREVRAGRDLIAAILAEPHDYNPSDEYYSCSQAEDYDPAPGEGGPGSGCSDPDRAGQPCDCGRDARVERLLRILAGVYEEGKARKP